MSTGIELAAQHDAVGRHDDAVNALAAAAGRGDVEAMTILSQRLVAGDRAPYLPTQGAQLLTEAARGGSIEAHLSLACLMALGVHVPQSWNGALGLLVQAAERGSESARGQLRTLARALDAPPGGGDDWLGLARTIDLGRLLAAPDGLTLNADPLVRTFPLVVEPALCSWLIGRARLRLRPAMIYTGEGTRDSVDQMRTNSIAVWNLGSMDLVHVLLQYRIAAACGVPLEHLEAPAALNYKPGERFTNHYDYLNPRSPNYQTEVTTRGERVITFLTYLNDDYEGGETDFPLIGVRHKGSLGSGLSFRSAFPGTEKTDDRSLHAGLAPLTGEKWLVCQFIRSKPVFNTQAENIA